MAWITSAAGKMMSARSLRSRQLCPFGQRQAAEEAAALGEGTGAQREAMEGGERVVLARGFHACQAANAAAQADQLAAHLGQPLELVELALDFNAEGFDLSVGGRVAADEAFRERQGAQGSRLAAQIAPVAHLADLGTAAADIDHGAVGKRHVVERADRAIVGFALPVQDAQGKAQLALDTVEEEAAVRGIADGAGGRGDDLRRRAHCRRSV